MQTGSWSLWWAIVVVSLVSVQSWTMLSKWRLGYASSTPPPHHHFTTHHRTDRLRSVGTDQFPAIDQFSSESKRDCSSMEISQPTKNRRDEIAEILEPTMMGEGQSPPEVDELGIEEEISQSIDILMEIDRQGKLNNLHPKFLLDRAAILCNGRTYEDVYTKRLSVENGEEAERLERINALLSGFISSERKSRTRLKVNYILAGAHSGRLDHAMQMLCDRCRAVIA
jgi:hypothetical protein